MQRMLGFRNVAVREYVRLNLDVVQTIITKQLCDFRVLLDDCKGLQLNDLPTNPYPRTTSAAKRQETVVHNIDLTNYLALTYLHFS